MSATDRCFACLDWIDAVFKCVAGFACVGAALGCLVAAAYLIYNAL